MTAAQLPEDGEIFFDHIAHFVGDIAAAEDGLQRCGFQTTPFVAQAAPGADGRMEPTGTGNVCAMFEAGYIEVLAKTSDTPLSVELDAAVARWPGVHLAAFAVPEPQAAYDRLLAAGVDMRPIVHLRRPVVTEHGASEARFTVLRPKSGVMPEGRIQLLTHHTEAQVWQPRWLAHPNGASALLCILIVSSDPVEAAGRFERLLGVAPVKHRDGVRFPCSRGHVLLLTPDGAEALIGMAPPGLPWIAAYGLRVDSLANVSGYLSEAGIGAIQTGGAVLVAFPASLGKGRWIFVEDEAGLPWN
jgi:hypothetical protein